MKVFLGCEVTGRVRDEFLSRGHDAISCDLLPTDVHGPHLAMDVFAALRILRKGGWVPDLGIFFPPCTYLCSSGLHWNTRRPERALATEEAIAFVMELANAPIPRIAIENPIGCLSSRWRKPDQIVQPWYFGDDASKATCLWLKNLPPLRDTDRLPGDARTRRANQTASGQNKLGPSPDRWKIRSATYPGIAAAMADQWGAL